MQEIIKLLPVLAIAIIMNIAAGMYYNIGTEKFRFDKTKLISGVIKGMIVAGLFIGSASCFEAIDLSSIGLEPRMIMIAAITIYVGKSLYCLAKILGVNIPENKTK